MIDYDPFEDAERVTFPRPWRVVRLIATVAGFMVLAFAGLVWVLLGPVEAHQAASGVVFPPECCNSAATHPTGDCAPIDDQYVTERADGYHIDLPKGAHPKLVTKGYSGVVPYSAARRPIDNNYNICLATDGASRFCFFPKPGAV